MSDRVFSPKPWIFNHPYTCPLLMWLQGIIKGQQWVFTQHSGWRLLESPTVVARCLWPNWLIMIEHRLWQRHFFLKAWVRMAKVRLRNV